LIEHGLEWNADGDGVVVGTREDVAAHRAKAAQR
jgi:hypothetical protein